MKPRGVRVITELAEKEVTFLTDVDAMFVSLVKHAANQMPFRVIKSDDGEVEKGGEGSGSWNGPGDPRFSWTPKPKFKGEPLNPNGKDTEAMYKDAAGNWTPERRAFHEKIIAYIMGNKTPVDNPVSYLMGGGTASGKTTLRKSGMIGLPENTVTVDPDDIKNLMPEYQAMLAEKDFKAAAFAHEESSYLSKVIVARASEQSKNVMLDGTGDSTYAKLKRKVETLRTRGQKVIAHYADMDMETALKISDKRYKETGRYVPKGFIKEVYTRIPKVVPRALKDGLFDEFVLWDNRKKGSPTKVVSAIGKDVTIHDKKKWNAFLAKGKK